MESNGKVINILAAQSGTSQSGKEWMAQTFVIQTPGQYSKIQAFELFGSERIANNLPNVGDEVNVLFDLESREWNGRYFTSARAYKVENAAARMQAPPPTQSSSGFAPTNQPYPQATPVQAPQATGEAPGEADDLPF